MNYRTARQRLVNWIGAQLIGPASDADILLGSHPTDRYPAGFLSPLMDDGLDAIADSEDRENIDGEDASDDTALAHSVALRRRFAPPASAGFSFFVHGTAIQFQALISAACYRRDGERDDLGRFIRIQYQRQRLALDNESIVLSQPANCQSECDGHSSQTLVFGNRARLDVIWRSHGSGWLVTVSLSNQQIVTGIEADPRQAVEEKTLFEVSLRMVLDSGIVGDYPRVDYALLSAEERELEFQYRFRKIYAVGHGCGVDWLEKNGRVSAIWLDFLPSVEVPQVTADSVDSENTVLELAYLASGSDATVLDEKVLGELQKFVSGYRAWVERQLEMANAVDGVECDTAGRIVARMESALCRMQSGIAYLGQSAIAADAFRIANRAMLLQMQKNASSCGKTVRIPTLRWRAFQLAFLLACVESAINPDDTFRDTVDLIWFPAGGGKTEAYLALIACVLAARRLSSTRSTLDSGGTAVLMRYTLRLLTAQQFQRASKMICALELVRRRDPRLGEQRFECGLWVGAAASPNTFIDAMNVVASIAAGNAAAAKQLVFDRCPWCDAAFSPSCYVATETAFSFHCAEASCEFGADTNVALPCNIVDEALYRAPPSLLLATIDKFARLVWSERTTAFLGAGRFQPPELIVQDELHLVAGELGSVAGLYEAALDAVLLQLGVRAKYIASTATIRMAHEQVERLYGRALAVFPPPGLSADDSYFARTVPLQDRPGRLYCGFLAPLLGSNRCMVPLVAAILQAPLAVFSDAESQRELLREAWWTLLVYHGSLKGVGNSHNNFGGAVRDAMARLQQERAQVAAHTPDPESSAAPLVTPLATARDVLRVAQLTSLSSASDNAATFNLLENTLEQGDCLDVVLATNMISVGLDVARLALMVINGQPLTSAEYIQTSSRVGRADVPGLVFTNYYRSQARSLSHYENFRAYHESFYRFVEPSSVTPFTHQARQRALHTAIVLLMRHSCPNLLADNAAGNFDAGDSAVAMALKRFADRCARADPHRAAEVSRSIDELVAQWSDLALRCAQEKVQLKYTAPNNDLTARRLLHSFEDATHTHAALRGLWPALNSMRNVENTALLRSRVAGRSES